MAITEQRTGSNKIPWKDSAEIPKTSDVETKIAPSSSQPITPAEQDTRGLDERCWVAGCYLCLKKFNATGKNYKELVASCEAELQLAVNIY